MHTPYQKITAYILFFSQMLMGCLNPIMLPDKNNLAPAEKSNTSFNENNLVETGNNGDKNSKIVPCQQETMEADWIDQAVPKRTDLELEHISFALDSLPVRSYNTILTKQKEIAFHKQNNINKACFLYHHSAFKKSISLAKSSNSASNLIETSQTIHTNQRVNQAKRKEEKSPLSANKTYGVKREQIASPNSTVAISTPNQNIQQVIEPIHPIKIQLQEGQEITLQKQIHAEKIHVVGTLPTSYLQAKFCEKFNGFSRELFLPVYGESALLNLEKLAKQDAAWCKQHMHIYWTGKGYTGFIYIGDWGLMGGGNGSSKGDGGSSGSSYTPSSDRPSSSSSSDPTNRMMEELSGESMSRLPIYPSSFRSSIPTYHPYTEYLPYQDPLYTPPHYSIHPTPFRGGTLSHGTTNNSFPHIPYSFVSVGNSSQEDAKSSGEESNLAMPNSTTSLETNQAKTMIQKAMVGEPRHFLDPAPSKPKDIKVEVEQYLEGAKDTPNKEEQAEKSKLLSKLNQLKDKEKSDYQGVYNSYAIGTNSEIGDKVLLDQLQQKDQEIHSLQALEDQLKTVGIAKQPVQPAVATKKMEASKKISSKIVVTEDQVQPYSSVCKEDADKGERILKDKEAVRQVGALKKEEDAHLESFFNCVEIEPQILEKQLSNRKQNLGSGNSLTEDVHGYFHIPYSIPESIDRGKQVEHPLGQEFKVNPTAITQAAVNALNLILKEENYANGKAVCNMGVNMVFEALTGSKELIDKNSKKGDPILSNDMLDYWSSSPNWEEISMNEAQELANQGQIVVAGCKAGLGEEHGHVVVIVPGEEEMSGKWGCKVPMAMDTGKGNRWASKMLSKSWKSDRQQEVKFFIYKGPINQ